ncbi:hypothetical protein D3C76_1699500 [compost metagenome]
MDEIILNQLDHRNIHRNPVGFAVPLLQLPDEAARFDQHPRADWKDQLAGLRNGNEGQRRHIAKHRTVPADQRLKA